MAPQRPHLPDLARRKAVCRCGRGETRTAEALKDIKIDQLNGCYAHWKKCVKELIPSSRKYCKGNGDLNAKIRNLNEKINFSFFVYRQYGVIWFTAVQEANPISWASGITKMLYKVFTCGHQHDLQKKVLICHKQVPMVRKESDQHSPSGCGQLQSTAMATRMLISYTECS